MIYDVMLAEHAVQLEGKKETTVTELVTRPVKLIKWIVS